MFGDISLSIILLQKVIIRYFSYPQGYKHYCKNINKNIPLAPEQCPLCFGRGCLLGHGWYIRIELVSGFSKRYGDFKIYRYLCRNTGRTLSMHPDFTHCYKRYLLNIVMYCLCSHDLEGKSWYRISLETGICPRTLLHWHHGFFRNEHIKKICFFPMSHSPPEESICLQLLELFDSDDTAITVFQGMVQLFYAYDCPLY